MDGIDGLGEQRSTLRYGVCQHLFAAESLLEPIDRHSLNVSGPGVPASQVVRLTALLAEVLDFFPVQPPIGSANQFLKLIIPNSKMGA